MLLYLIVENKLEQLLLFKGKIKVIYIYIYDP